MAYTPHTELPFKGASFKGAVTPPDDAIHQVAHGFVVGNVLRVEEDSSGVVTFVLAQADTTLNAKVVGIVKEVMSADWFRYQSNGIIYRNTQFFESVALETGKYYFLAPTVAGTIIEEPTWGTNQIPVCLGFCTDKGFHIQITSYTLNGGALTQIAAEKVIPDTTNFNGLFSTISEYNNLQKILDKLDDNVLDSRYYTETEINNLLSGYSPTSHGHTFDSLSGKPNSLSGYGIADAYDKDTINAMFINYEEVVNYGTTNEYYRGDKTWQTLNTAAVAEHGSYLYFTPGRARAAITENITGITYNSILGRFSLDTGYVIPLQEDINKGLTAYSWGNHAGIYEPAFSKNTGFNKNFGTTTGTVLEGRTFGTAANSAATDFEAAITKSTGYAKWTGSAWSFVNETYSLSSHNHDSAYAPISGSANYIQNQYVSAQTANMLISGNINAGYGMFQGNGENRLNIYNDTSTGVTFILYDNVWNGAINMTGGNLYFRAGGNTVTENRMQINTAGNVTATTFQSTVATGTAPFTVASTTVVTNLHADFSNSLDSNPANNLSSRLQYWNAVNRTDINPDTGWWYGLRMGHGDADTYYSATLAIDFHADTIKLRRRVGGTLQSWVTLLNSGGLTTGNLVVWDGSKIANLSNGSEGYVLKISNGAIAWVSSSTNEIYKGTWNANTNTPTLANGTGTAGDYYICSTAGTTNFGAGNITFAVGDRVSYSGSIWQFIAGVGYNLQIASGSVLGGVKIGTGVSVDGNGVISVSTAYRASNWVPAFSDITSKPTTISGYGITDAMSTSHTANSITGFGTSGTATTVSRSDHGHSGVYEPANANIQSHIGSAHQTIINGNGFVKASGTSLSYDTNTYLTDAADSYLYGRSANNWVRIYDATTSVKGLMSASDKSKLDGIEAQSTRNTGWIFNVSGTPIGTILMGNMVFTPGNGIEFINVSHSSGNGYMTIQATGGGTTTNAVTFDNSGLGAASGTTFNGSVARTISYNTIGASASGHAHDDRYYTETEINNTLSAYATQSYVTGLGYITISALTGYATQSWVVSQGYLTASTQTSHADVLVDGDFSANGIMIRTAAATYSTIADGTANYFLKTNGSGTYTWAAALADPMTTRGDIMYRNSSNVTARLGIGGNGTFLSSNGTDVSWGNIAQFDVSGANWYKDGLTITLGDDTAQTLYRFASYTASGTGAIFGQTTAEPSVSNVYGVYGEATSANYGIGVGGYSYGTYGNGVFGNGWIGVKGSSTMSSGIGGYFSAGSNAINALYAIATSGGSTAIIAVSTGTSGTTYGGRFSASSTSGSGYGVYADGKTYDFYATGTGTDYGSASSIRWKTNIMEIPNALEKVNSMRGVYFDWIKERGGKHSVGFIAEEVGKILPEIVQYEANGIDADGMSYGKITPLLLQAIKELSAEVKELRERLNKYE